MARSPTRCPCDTGLPYASCCGPYHQGRSEAPDAVALMRSRYAAFATRQVEYLARTLHPEHPDASAPRQVLVASLRASCDSNRYMGLRVLDHRPPDEQGVARVLFHARVFSGGRDQSFVERSRFLHDGVGWRYRDGELSPAAGIGDVSTLTIDKFSP